MPLLRINSILGRPVRRLVAIPTKLSALVKHRRCIQQVPRVKERHVVNKKYDLSVRTLHGWVLENTFCYLFISASSIPCRTVGL